MSKRETVIVELKLQGTRLQLRYAVNELKGFLEALESKSSTNIELQTPTTLELLAHLNESLISAQLRSRLKEIS